MSAKKVFEDVEMEQPVTVSEPILENPRVKQLVRFMGSFTIGTEVTAIQEVDRQLSDYVNLGWKLFNTHFIGVDQNGNYRVLYILTKD